ncbi:hypothetical protein, partial [Jeotgalicoccus psychrophilus]|uniref:hypothetical protein n=1 Tax=Jeotgalicoccus psychrophilus TaxID=157228 RepID=UPI001B7FE295
MASSGLITIYADFGDKSLLLSRVVAELMCFGDKSLASSGLIMHLRFLMSRIVLKNTTLLIFRPIMSK